MNEIDDIQNINVDAPQIKNNLLKVKVVGVNIKTSYTKPEIGLPFSFFFLLLRRNSVTDKPNSQKGNLYLIT